MINFYKARYGEEVEAVFADGVEYDEDEDGTVTNDERSPSPLNRLSR